jgi:hypothetical protein
LLHGNPPPVLEARKEIIVIPSFFLGLKEFPDIVILLQQSFSI